jgi:tRNA pseudouridine55 synthase
MDGILNVNKPLGWTSFDVVGFVRRHSGVKRVGHAGTLDPAAEGVLLVCLGQATRVVEYLMDAPKSYLARIRLGAATDTYDADGSIVRTGDPSGVTPEQLETTLLSFKGAIQQKPPIYSAIKREGVPLYKYARAGKEVELEARSVEVYDIALVDFATPTATVRVDCSRGTYIRSIAHDLGELLGCGAHLEGLVRLAIGPFRVEAAVDIERLREALESDSWRDLVLPIDSVLLDWRAAILGEENADNARTGRTLDLQPLDEERVRSLPEGAQCRAYSLDGRLIALLRYEGEGRIWRPEKVFLS